MQFLLSSAITALGLSATLGSAAAVARQADNDAFLITRAYLTSPSGRPGSDQYCSILLNVTDPTTQSTARCEARYGPCATNSQDPPAPALPLDDASHAAPCVADPAAEDDDFTFYFDAYASIDDYSVRITRGGREAGSVKTGSTGPVNREAYPGVVRYQCGGSGFCSSWLDGVVVRAPFDDGAEK